MSRSHAQQLRLAGSQPSFQTKVKRQQYWSSRLAAEQQRIEQSWVQDMAALGHTELKDLTQFETANIVSATLSPPNANAVAQGMSAQAAGLDPSTGAIPPPPPGL